MPRAFATPLPGLIDGHVHLTDAQGNLQHQQLVALNSATRSLNAGYTTLVAMGSHGGGYADVELKKAIESGVKNLLTSTQALDWSDEVLSVQDQTVLLGAGDLTAQETFDDAHSFHGVAGLPFLKQHLAG